MKRILPVIVISQFLCTSLWFAGNAVIAEMARDFQLPAAYLGHLASAVQLGFIAGTLLFAMLALADRFSASAVFLWSACLAAFFNLAVTFLPVSAAGLIGLRFCTGFFLAGIYPVGMKIAADYYREKLGKSLGFLVGALVLGTAFPHFIRNLTETLPWRYVMYTTSALAVAGGLAMQVLVPAGPYRQPAQKPSLLAFVNGFRDPGFRSASLGYFGHMWELYSFWVFVPVMITAYTHRYPQANANIHLLSFLVIAAGSLSCVLGGYLSQRMGVKRTASAALALSCACCLVSPIFLYLSSYPLFLGYLLVWSMAVIADSPLFSTLVARSAPAHIRGASLTIVNCIGFSITIGSIQLMNVLANEMNGRFMYMALAAGPILGLLALRKNIPSPATHPL